MQFDKYQLREADCAYMQEGLNYLQGGDVFFIPIVRDKKNTQTLYNAIEFPPEYKALESRLRLYCIEQYKITPQTKLKKERLFIVIPRVLLPRLAARKQPSQAQKPLQMRWLDETQ